MLHDARGSALICTGRLTDWAGSEIVTIELTEELCAQGIGVTVYAHAIDPVREQALRDAGAVHVTSAPNDINVAGFDLVYSQQNSLTRLITPATIRAMAQNGAPFFVYGHLSSFVEMEAPLSRLEWYLADIIVANSVETKERLKLFGIHPDAIAVVPNPVTRPYLERPGRNGQSKSVLIVSNHIPAELHQARELLMQAGWTVDILGKNGRQAMVTPELLAAYETIITIGKTVQMGLSLGRKIYCYDHFGGPGWLTPDNFPMAAAQNFSGRCTTQRKSAQDIYADIAAGCTEPPLPFRRSRHSLRAWVALLLAQMRQQGRKSLHPDNIAGLMELATLDGALSTICMQAFDSFAHWTKANEQAALIQKLNQQNAALTQRVAELEQESRTAAIPL